MSMERIETIICPKCGQENKIIVWDSLNGDLDPEAKEKLLNGTLFRFKCTKCGYESNVEYNLLYHDMKNNVMVYLVHPDVVDKTIQEMINLEKTLPVKMRGYKKRVVCDQNELREKAIIFDNGLDDRVVEIIKFIYLIKVQQQFPEKVIEAVYMMFSDEKMTLHFFMGETKVIDIPKELYDGICKDFEEKLKEVGDSDFIVNINWVKKILS